MPVTLLASFPNSRIKPRPARTSGNTNNQTILAGATVLIYPADLNRVSLLLRNDSPSDTLLYSYTSVNIATEGFPIRPGEAVLLESPQDIWVHNPSANPIDISEDVGVG